MKVLFISVVFLSLSTACSGLVKREIAQEDKAQVQAVIGETQVEESLKEDVEAPSDTHEIVEARADEEEIAQKVGSSEIDEEVVPEEAVSLEVEPNFLKPKKTRRMEYWLSYFVEKDRERFQRFINNGEEYRAYIEEIFTSYGLPKDLYYLGLIESGYYLGARSRARAVGPWQFIKGTGKRYGLKITREIDERRDLFKSTHAAARYLRDLYNVFSNWELALASYNAGENGIMRRIMKYKSRDYYVLSKRKKLPAETRNYVPKLLAAMEIIKNAEKYGFVRPKPSGLFDQTELYKVGKNLSLKAIARHIKLDYKAIRKLNPELIANKTPRYFRGGYRLRLPKGVGELLEGAPIKESRNDLIRRTAKAPSHYKVKRGDTLIGLARRFGTTPRKLASLNGLSSWRSELKMGQRLRVSGKPRPKRYRPIVYKVKAGDNLSSLAQLFNLRASEIKRANKLKSGKIFVGQRLVLPKTKKGVYVVRSGDYLGRIARKFNRPVQAILKLNSLKRKTVYPGQRLIVDID